MSETTLISDVSKKGSRSRTSLKKINVQAFEPALQTQTILSDTTERTGQTSVLPRIDTRESQTDERRRILMLFTNDDFISDPEHFPLVVVPPPVRVERAVEEEALRNITNGVIQEKHIDRFFTDMPSPFLQYLQSIEQIQRDAQGYSHESQVFQSLKGSLQRKGDILLDIVESASEAAYDIIGFSLDIDPQIVVTANDVQNFLESHINIMQFYKNRQTILNNVARYKGREHIGQYISICDAFAKALYGDSQVALMKVFVDIFQDAKPYNTQRGSTILDTYADVFHVYYNEASIPPGSLPDQTAMRAIAKEWRIMQPTQRASVVKK